MEVLISSLLVFIKLRNGGKTGGFVATGTVAAAFAAAEWFYILAEMTKTSLFNVFIAIFV